MKKMACILSILLLCAGCVKTYTHTSKSGAAFEQDRAACERTAKQKLARQGVT
ncbi:MAG TPA: hypothetical protein VHO84_13670 [Syntrophorhabdaceae bacterium]|nr:hypothetical protein [Syntrophorhabdaceae bacterium]